MRGHMMARDETIAYVVVDPASTGLVTDFDGVLSPIVADPASSRLLDGTGALLSGIAKHLKLVALLSGRPLDFLRDRASIEGVTLLGSYGLEEMRDGVPATHPDISTWLPTVRNASAELHRVFDGTPGLTVEDKTISVAVHWRQADDQADAGALVERTMRRLAISTGLVAEPGKLVMELLPPVRQDKGTAIRRLIETYGLTNIVYAGDDLGDVPALRLVADRGGQALVVTHDGETPPPVVAAATRTFDGVEAFAGWLADLRAALD